MISQQTPAPMPADSAPLRVESVLTMGADERRWLWVGNSLTFQHRLPRLVAQMVQTRHGSQIGTRMVTRGGATLDWHRQEGHATAALDEGIWHRVILQDQSRRPADDPPASLADLVWYGQRARNLGAEPMLYATWARSDDPGMIAGLTDTYRRAAQELGCPWAPVGAAFAIADRELPHIPLRIDDHLHPTMAGSWLAACVWLLVLDGEGPRPDPRIEDACAVLANLPEDHAQALDAVARQAVQEAL